MRMPSVAITAIACVAFFSTQGALASDEVRHVNAHVHGQGLLNFAVDGSQLQMEVTMPMYDILGFESINTAAQEQQLQAALELLESADLWQPSSAAKCQLVDVNATVLGHDDHKDHDEHGHHEHHEHHEHHGEHGHREGDHDSHGTHSDVFARYTFECRDIAQLNSLTTALFNTFSNSERVQVQGFTAKGQISAEMNRATPGVQF